MSLVICYLPIYFIGYDHELVVGDEVEVNNSNDQFTSLASRTPKGDLFSYQDDFNRTASTDNSPGTVRFTPEVESNCSTPSNSEFNTPSSHLSVSTKKHPLKRSTFEEMILEEVPSFKKRACAFSPPIVPCEPNPNALNRVHYVLQKGQTLILQTEKPNNRLSQTISSQSRFKAING